MIAQIVNGFLQEKLEISGSEKTFHTYASAINRFREITHKEGIDLLPDEDISQEMKREYEKKLSKAVRVFLKTKNQKTANLRRSVLNSFYTNERVQKARPCLNPVEQKNSKKKKPEKISPQQFAAIISTIDLSTPIGLRDSSLLCCLVEMNVSASALTRLTTKNMVFSDPVTLTYRYTRTQLSDFTSTLLLQWLNTYYQKRWEAETLPLWVNFSPSHKGEKKALSAQGITGILRARLGTGTPLVDKEKFLLLVNDTIV